MVALNSARIVVTIPPRQWFGGLDRRASFAMLQQLEQRFGTTFYQFDTGPFVVGDTRRQAEAVENLRAFRPHLAISLSNAAYGLACAIKCGNGKANVFTDILNIPLMMLWDHGLYSFPTLTLNPPATRPEDSQAGALRAISGVIDNPLMYHQPLDAGQVAEMQRIGLLHSDKIDTIPAMAYEAFLKFGRQPPARNYAHDVTFVGNVFLSDQYRPATDQSVGAQCLRSLLDGRARDPTTPAWTALVRHLEALPPSERSQARLDYDQSYFWHFANDAVCVQVNTHDRMQLLNSLKRRIAFYGAFADPAGIPRLADTGYIDYQGYVDFATELPAVYARSRILVDLTNAAFISNCSTKPICCFASGGFALFDYRPDPIAHLGSEIEQVMYKSHDDLNAKIDYFLTHEREREALADHLKDVVQRKCNYTDSIYAPAVRILSEHAGTGVWSTLKETGYRVFGALTGSTSPLQVGEDDNTPTSAAKRLPMTVGKPEVEPQWAGAQVLSYRPIRVRTADSAWGYSALIEISKLPRRSSKKALLWLELKVRMESGRAAFSLLLDDGALCEEKLVEAEDTVTSVFFAVPRAGVRGVLIRSAEVPSSVLEIVDIELLTDRRGRQA